MGRKFKVVVFGKQGQVALSLRALVREYPQFEFRFVGRPECDLDQPLGLAAKVAGMAPDLVINAAAYTDVDGAENDQHRAYVINALSAGEIAKGAARCRAPILHISTDYVFDGRKTTPYTETDKAAPNTVYGKTKLDGERFVLGYNRKALVLRTAWVYSVYGSNFVKTMLRVGADRDVLKVVDDQRGCPTSGEDLAKTILECAHMVIEREGPENFGVFHVSGTGETSWAEFANEIFRNASIIGFDSPKVVPISTHQYPTPAKRPANSVLSCDKFEKAFGHRLPHWKTSVERTVRTLLAR